MQYDDIKKLNDNFKSSLFKEVLINVGLIVSTFVFFYILYDSTRAFFFGIYDLSWKTIIDSRINK